MLVRTLCCLLALSWVTLANAEIYKTLDKHGNPVYTDRAPSGDSEKVKLPTINSVPAIQSTSTHNYPPEPTGTTPAAYELHIISPRSDVSIPPGQRDLAIALDINQPIRQGHLLAYYLNGELIEETTSTSIIVRDLNRGTHKLMVEVLDEAGNSLAQSPEVIVNVIRPSVIRPKPAS